MKIANDDGCAVSSPSARSSPTMNGQYVIDIAELSRRAFGPDLRCVYDNWTDVQAFGGRT